jgi:hypothetical protein
MEQKKKDRLINYNFFHWGPFLYRTTLIKEELKKINNLCSKKNNDYRKNLAGIIKHEHAIDSKKIFPILFPYFQSYFQAFNEHYGQINTKKYGNKIELKSAWVNYMVAGESNPLHIHDDDLSFVLFTKIPKDLFSEYKKHVGGTKPGTINFIHSLNTGRYLLNQHTFFPVVGDLFIFPANLHHYVNTFKSKGERVSVSGNLKVING